MKAIWNGTVIAESNETVEIEGNQYFPPGSIKQEYFKSTDMHTTCPWKGQASYYSIEVNGDVNKNAAWYYPTPKEGSIERAGHDFTNYVAFWNGVQVTE